MEEAGRSGKSRALDLVFDVAWDNSWRDVPEIGGGTNHDAVWVFVKCKRTTRLTLDAELWEEIVEGCCESDCQVGRKRLQLYAKPIARRMKHFLFMPFEAGYSRSRKRLTIVPELPETLQLSEEVWEESEEPPHFRITCESVEDGRVTVVFGDYTAGWDSVNLSTFATDHAAPTGSVIATVADGAGALLYRSKDNPGRGSVHFQDVRLRLDEHFKQYEDTHEQAYFWIHALRMVQVPQGPYWLGGERGRKGESNCFYDARDPSGPFQVTSEDAIPVVAEHAAPEADPSQSAPVASDEPTLAWNNARQFGEPEGLSHRFPKGFDQFYCMRTSLTQGEYADFINSLEGEAKTVRYPYLGENSYRFAIYRGHRYRVAARPLRPVNYLSWADARAYLWWAGLRPMTELEFEKACKGPERPVHGEFAWGTTRADRIKTIVGDEANGFEALDGNIHAGNGDIVLQGGDGGLGPVRADAFAYPGRQNADWLFPSSLINLDLNSLEHELVREERVATGASYWGIFGMSGNVWEYVVSAGTKEGRAFEGEHGGGALTALGTPDEKLDDDLFKQYLHESGEHVTLDVSALSGDEASWPRDNARGIGFRGGAFYPPLKRALVADRWYASGLKGYSARSMDTGCRGVRGRVNQTTEDES